MQMFAGTFAMCTEDPTIATVEECVTAGNTWENPPGNSFDNFGSAMLALFLQVRSPGLLPSIAIDYSSSRYALP